DGVEPAAGAEGKAAGVLDDALGEGVVGGRGDTSGQATAAHRAVEGVAGADRERLVRQLLLAVVVEAQDGGLAVPARRHRQELGVVDVDVGVALLVEAEDRAPVWQAIEPAQERLAEARGGDLLSLVPEAALAIQPDAGLAKPLDLLRGELHGESVARNEKSAKAAGRSRSSSGGGGPLGAARATAQVSRARMRSLVASFIFLSCATSTCSAEVREMWRPSCRKRSLIARCSSVS